MTKTAPSRLLWSAGLILLASVSGVALYTNLPGGGAQAETSEAAPEAAPAIPVSVAAVEARDVTLWREFSGRLEAVDRVQLRSRVAGAIQAVHFREGALVKQGDLLVSIDPAPFQAAVAQAQAQVEAAKARVELARLELERGRKLVASRTVSQSDLDQRMTTAHEAEASLRSAEAALQAAKLDLGYTEIRAPISGRAGRFEITPGNLVAAGSASPVLTTLVSADPIYASFDVSEEFVAKALAELPASESGAPAVERIPVRIATSGQTGKPIEGHLQLINNEVDTASGTVRVRAVLDNKDGRLIPGQFARIEMGEPKPERQLLISERAIGTDQDKKFVLVVGADNKIAYREVKLGEAAEGLRIVQSGLEPGERVVVNGLQRVRPGALIEPQMVAMTTSEQPLATAQR
ncbi:MexE family multidrug efflux RND transporter periplasmic adaptor subunit [Brucella endophytica]|uniref:MexE family multidrug efflux RND transporter periplasmic adaptor subunit n=1 Tax=Brucella endophytica TaxID=1963359 RepID=A0A916WEH1_9HYPH|nr:efflux RND transporter periplasmic adaptor subunit [Brucella endophytica]GGA93071.1 MexE family multidrug efflux RND transporter periplasmic adaptor subunit [Brucella endophytica]